MAAPAGDGGSSGVRRVRQKLGGAVTRGWLLVGALVGVGMLPCPDCGGPMIVHYWPIAVLVVAFQALRRRRGKMSAEEETSWGGEILDRPERTPPT